MNRYILFAKTPTDDGGGSDEVRRSNVKVLSESGSMILVEGEDADVQELAGKLPDWKISPQRQYQIPEVRPKTRKPG